MKNLHTHEDCKVHNHFKSVLEFVEETSTVFLLLVLFT